MAKRTLLEIVQEVLNDIDGDEVNSINDTIESSQVAEMVRSTFVAMTSNRNWPHQRRLISFEPFSDPSRPTHIKVPENVKEIISINYNKSKSGDSRKKYGPVNFKEPDAFLRMLNARDDSKDNIDVIIDESGVELFIRNDTAPTYYTSFDDNIIIFDSYDKSVDSTIQESKIQAMAYVMLDFVMSDDHIPNLPEEAFTSLIEEVKSRAAFKLKQFQDGKAEQESNRQRSWLSRKAWRVSGGTKYMDYGRRRGSKSSKNPTFRKDN